MAIIIWLLVLGVLAGGVGAVWRWRRRKFPRPGWLFGLWAPTVYALIALAAWAVGWGASSLLLGLDPGVIEAQRTLFTLLVLTALALVPIVGLTLFVRWVLQTNIMDVPK